MRHLRTFLTVAFAFALAAACGQTAVHAGTMTLAGPTTYNEIQPGPTPGTADVLDPSKFTGNQFGVSYVISNAVPGGINVNDWANALQDFNTNQAAGPWTFKFMGTALDSTLTINNYSAGITPKGGYGAQLNVTLKLNDPNISLNDVRFLQEISTNKPISNTNTVPPAGTFTPQTYIDPRPGDDVKQGDKEELPFYYTMAEDPGQKNAGNNTYTFSDFSGRSFEVGTYWQADLMIAVWPNARNADGSVKDRTVDIYDGIEWGFDHVASPEPSSMILVGMAGLALCVPAVRKRAGALRNAA